MNPGHPEGLIWATRGRSWGFRFLLDGGLADPLFTYERAFADFPEEPDLWRKLSGRAAALRFLDPDGRRDLAGRPIPHDFVLLRWRAQPLTSFESAREAVWNTVADAYARVWDLDQPPTDCELWPAVGH